MSELIIGHGVRTVNPAERPSDPTAVEQAAVAARAARDRGRLVFQAAIDLPVGPEGADRWSADDAACDVLSAVIAEGWELRSMSTTAVQRTLVRGIVDFCRHRRIPARRVVAVYVFVRKVQAKVSPA